MSADVIPFVPKPVPDRDALIRQARENYAAVFPDVPDTAPCEYVPPESDPA